MELLDPMTQRPIPERPDELPSFFGEIWKGRKILAIFLGVALVLGAIYTLFIPPVWEAKATLVFPTRPPSILGASGFADQASLAASLVGGATPLKVYTGFLESDRTLDTVSKAVDMDRLTVKDMRDISDSSTQSTITVTAKSRDPELAKKVVALHLKALDEINEDVAEPMYSDDLNVLRNAVAKQRVRITDAEERLRDFQKHSETAPTITPIGTGKDAEVLALPGTWDLQLRQAEIQLDGINGRIESAQSRTRQLAATSADLPSDLPPAKRWRSVLSDLEYQLRVKEITLAPTAPEIVSLKKQIGVTRAHLKTEIAAYVKAVGNGNIDPTGDSTSEAQSGVGSQPAKASLPSLLTERVGVEAQIAALDKLAKLAPDESVQLSRLLRDVATQGAILQQLEAEEQVAQIQAKRNPNHWEVLDTPRIEDKAVNKSFSKNLTVALVLGLILGCIGALLGGRSKRQRLA